MKSLSGVRLLATPWTAAYQAALSVGFSTEAVLRLLIIWRRSPDSCLPGPSVPPALPLCSQAEVSMGAVLCSWGA